MGFTAFLLKNLLRRKVRSLLTTLAIALAVGTMVTLLGLSDSFKDTFQKLFAQRGVALVVMERDQPMQLLSSLDEKLGERIRKIPGVRDVDCGLSDYSSIHKGPEGAGTEIFVLVQGWKADSFMMAKFRFLEGRKFAEGEHNVALVGARLAENLHKKVGDNVNLSGESFKVIGIYEGLTAIENGFLVVPLQDLQRMEGKKGKVTGFSVILDQDDEKTIQSVKEAIENLTNEKGKSLRLSAGPLTEYVGGSLHVQVVHAMAWMMSVIAVVIGLIGMLNTMLMAVFERVREIGILRAIGWRRSRVVRMVLGESLMLSLAGALVGVVGAVLVTHWLTMFPQVNGFIEGEVSLWVILEGTLMAVGVGLIGGIYPALRAANLKPTEALRHE